MYVRVAKFELMYWEPPLVIESPETHTTPVANSCWTNFQDATRASSLQYQLITVKEPWAAVLLTVLNVLSMSKMEP